jgi:hypothetical protein
MKFNHDELDQVINDALAHYREADPLAGLEERVLQRLRLSTEQRKQLWWRWGLVAAAAAALVIVAWIGFGDRVQRYSGATSVAKKQEPQSKIPGSPRHAGSANQHHTSLARTSHKPPVTAMTSPSGEAEVMRGRFPSPAPLKPEERMLLALASTHPEVLLDKPKYDKEIVIAPINIKPLVDESGEWRGEN